MPRKNSTTPAEKKAKLVELAGIRVPKALSAIKNLGNLANYDPNKNQQDTILNALRAALKGVEARFAGATTEPEFKLPA